MEKSKENTCDKIANITQTVYRYSFQTFLLGFRDMSMTS
jgi:hypothetical protein